MNKYVTIIDKILSDTLLDFSSFRVQLVYWALIMNFVVMYLVAFKGVDYKAFVASFGALTICYGFYFKSKGEQAKIENGQDPEDNDVPVNRDPDAN